MRLLGGLALLALFGAIAAFIALPNPVDSWLAEGWRSIFAAIIAGLIGVSMTSMLVYAYVRFRLPGLIKAAERMARGELDVKVKARPSGGGLEGRLARALAQLSVALVETTDAATMDKLTGVGNRHSLLVALLDEVERANRYGRPLSVAFVDIDHFKAVNDTYGHAAGDIVLRGVAQTIKSNLRASDSVGRYGGEEFMLLLSETNPEDAAVLAEKLRNLVQRQRFNVEGNPQLNVTVSIGIAGGSGGLLRTDTL